MTELEAVIKQAKDKYGTRHKLSKEYFIKGADIRGQDCELCGMDFLNYDIDHIMEKECFGWKDKILKDIDNLTKSAHANE